ncbi:hypothetical protein Micbo1qcDRAFT_1791 [Microdochium bolleyi]|uniref:Uncharacterized protein n=1 Tax=Microdochium bolleyi TaxID=196109 RepID=A0A136JHG8_9PEZI|nr:hypothetical protein Micbo1qcDRAFT_1791 [Microdochium bolleyi]
MTAPYLFAILSRHAQAHARLDDLSRKLFGLDKRSIDLLHHVQRGRNLSYMLSSGSPPISPQCTIITRTHTRHMTCMEHEVTTVFVPRRKGKRDGSAGLPYLHAHTHTHTHTHTPQRALWFILLYNNIDSIQQI